MRCSGCEAVPANALKIAAAAIGLALCVTSAGYANAGGGVTASVVVKQNRFLSTETPQAQLTVVNDSQHPVFFNPCGVQFLIYSRTGWHRRSACTFMASIRASARIDPSTRYSAGINLPLCQTYSSPCAENVIVEFSLFDGKTSRLFTSRLPQYEVVPDPTATYAVPGLRGSRPLFIVPGVARDTFFPDRMVLEFTASASEAHPPFTSTPRLVGELVTALTKAGVSVGGSGFDTDGDRWKVQITVDDAAAQRVAIAAALEKIRADFSGRVSSIVHYFEFDPFSQTESLASAAAAQTHREALQLAAMTGAGDIQPASSAYSQPRVYINAQIPDRSFPDLSRALPYYKPVILNQGAQSPTSVLMVTEDLFTGSTPARLPTDPAILQRAASAFRPAGSWFLPPLDRQAVIAADRPELYVEGTSSAEASLAEGLAPYFVAALNARTKTRDLAAILGVHAGVESLFAVYPRGRDDDLHTLGLATTFTDAADRRFDRIPALSGATAFREDDSRLRDMVPITAPGDETLITEMAGAAPKQRPDALRFDVEFITGQDAETSKISKAQLLSMPHVMDAAVHTEPHDARYEVVLHGSRKSDLTSVLNVLSAAYAPLHPSVRFQVEGISLNCAGLEDRLLKATIRENWMQAKADSAREGKRLRKLLLVATFPPDRRTTCLTRAQDPGSVGSPSTAQPHVPESVQLSVTSMMVFRTFPPGETSP